MATSVDPARILQSWDVPPPNSIERAARGTNNLTWIVDCGEKFVLRVYNNIGNGRHVKYELALLKTLRTAPLTFSVPSPLLTRAGDIVIPVRAADRASLASLCPYIPGRHPMALDVADARISGTALAELDEALHDVNLSRKLVRRSSYGHLQSIHAMVPNPVQAFEELNIDSRQRQALQDLLAAVEGGIPYLYSQLPQQIIHSDLGRSSVLIESGQVTGILDFEFAALDIRAMDFVVGLYMFASCDPFDISLECASAFAAGFRARLRLTAEEIEAIPTLLRLRQIVSTLHRLGRWRQGVATYREVTDHVKTTLLVDEWLHDHESALHDAVAA